MISNEDKCEMEYFATHDFFSWSKVFTFKKESTEKCNPGMHLGMEKVKI